MENKKSIKPKIYSMAFSKIYPFYVAKAEKKWRTKSEVDEIICWLTWYSQKELEKQLEKEIDIETFILESPKLTPSRLLIKWTICGVKIEDIQEPVMKEIRYLDKLVDELAKGKTMEKILRS